MINQAIRNVGGKISGCEAIIKYKFRNKLLCLEALNSTRLPIDYASRKCLLARNDSMAILGDALMTAMVCRRQWTIARTDRLSNARLMQVGRARGLDQYRLVADAMEAVLGAVYLDGGEKAMDGVVQHLGLDKHPFL
ncbi:hypothetical protein K504DRAFT_471744 [Pleomassaria siparia CBS 279.74]|uniref:RNase III domain-containing protein n=1 Tax=Pleomassaria siparia CBS 279.74 TaxID=1314801 RepID=A0A6G1JXP9_9PLEO|nr:hypothetical protein K504DRAFT_471744 [Pleomassaria siparia CBS 279.74]